VAAIGAFGFWIVGYLRLFSLAAIGECKVAFSKTLLNQSKDWVGLRSISSPSLGTGDPVDEMPFEEGDFFAIVQGWPLRPGSE
jgi:hypothetical protein